MLMQLSFLSGSFRKHCYTLSVIECTTGDSYLQMHVVLYDILLYTCAVDNSFHSPVSLAPERTREAPPARGLMMAGSQENSKYIDLCDQSVCYPTMLATLSLSPSLFLMPHRPRDAASQLWTSLCDPWSVSAAIVSRSVCVSATPTTFPSSGTVQSVLRLAQIR